MDGQLSFYHHHHHLQHHHAVSRSIKSGVIRENVSALFILWFRRLRENGNSWHCSQNPSLYAASSDLRLWDSANGRCWSLSSDLWEKTRLILINVLFNNVGSILCNYVLAKNNAFGELEFGRRRKSWDFHIKRKLDFFIIWDVLFSRLRSFTLHFFLKSWLIGCNFCRSNHVASSSPCIIARRFNMMSLIY